MRPKKGVSRRLQFGRNGYRIFFRRIDTNNDASGACRSLAGTALRSELSGLGGLPDDPLCDSDDDPNGTCNAYSTEVEIYYKATGCWVLVLDQNISLGNEGEYVYGLDDDPEAPNSTYHAVLDEAERLTACCQGDVVGCCGEGVTSCDELDAQGNELLADITWDDASNDPNTGLPTVGYLNSTKRTLPAITSTPPT